MTPRTLLCAVTALVLHCCIGVNITNGLDARGNAPPSAHDLPSSALLKTDDAVARAQVQCPGVAPTPPPPPFPSADFEVFQHGNDNGTFCCDQTACSAPSPQGHGSSSFLFAGPISAAACAEKCLAAFDPDRCHFIVTAGGAGGNTYCMNAQYCNTTNHFSGNNVTIWRRTLPPRPPSPPPTPTRPPPAAFSVIDPLAKRALMEKVSRPFYSGDSGPGMHGQGIPTDEHIAWATDHFPFFECDDAELETAYYFRMYSYHNHLNLTRDDGYIVTEFYPHVPWAGKHNTIPCAAGHHIHEGRWLRDEQVRSSTVLGYLCRPSILPLGLPLCL